MPPLLKPGRRATPAEGERFFFGKGGCSTCHTALGRGGSRGPDLSDIGRQLTPVELEQSLTDPGARIAPGYGVVEVTLKNGSMIRGFARSRGNHDLQLQTFDGELRLLSDKEYTRVRTEQASSMPAIRATAEERRDLVAWLSRLGGIVESGQITRAIAEPQLFLKSNSTPFSIPSREIGPLTSAASAAIATVHSIRSIRAMPAGCSSSGSTRSNTSRLKPLRWFRPASCTSRAPIRSSRSRRPIGAVRDLALRPVLERRLESFAGDAALGAQRQAVSQPGDRVFFATDNAHMLCLNRLTGALLWDVYMPESPQHYGVTSAPLVVGDLVISGVAGADDGIRGFIGAWKVTTGELAWRFWTVPKPGEPGSETWKGNAIDAGGASSWLTGT